MSGDASKPAKMKISGIPPQVGNSESLKIYVNLQK